MQKEKLAGCVQLVDFLVHTVIDLTVIIRKDGSYGAIHIRREKWTQDCAIAIEHDESLFFGRYVVRCGSCDDKLKLFVAPFNREQKDTVERDELSTQFAQVLRLLIISFDVMYLVSQSCIIPFVQTVATQCWVIVHNMMKDTAFLLMLFEACHLCICYGRQLYSGSTLQRQRVSLLRIVVC
jgi:hypothetical protein